MSSLFALSTRLGVQHKTGLTGKSAVSDQFELNFCMQCLF